MKIHIKPEDIPSDENRAAAQDKIDSLRDIAGKELSRWERGFLDSIEQWVTEHRFLTSAQRQKLDELCDEHLG
jgi:hypothetical protein